MGLFAFLVTLFQYDPTNVLIAALVVVIAINTAVSIRRKQEPRYELVEVQIHPEPIDLSEGDRDGWQERFLSEELWQRGGYAPTKKIMRWYARGKSYQSVELPSGGYLFWFSIETPPAIAQYLKDNNL